MIKMPKFPILLTKSFLVKDKAGGYKLAFMHFHPSLEWFFGESDESYSKRNGARSEWYEYPEERKLGTLKNFTTFDPDN